MKVLVTGAAGVVGRAVTKVLESGHELVLLDFRPIDTKHKKVTVDIRDWRMVRKLLARHRTIDAVIHTVYSPDHDDREPEENAANQFDVSVKSSWIILNEAIRLGAKKLIYASSMSVFGNLKNVKITDSSDPGQFEVSAYGLCKLLGEDVVRNLAYSHHIEGVSLRLYGVHEPGFMERRGTHVEDVGRAFKLALEKSLGTYEAINLPPGIPGINISGTKAKRLLGWQPEHIFENKPELEDWAAPTY